MHRYQTILCPGVHFDENSLAAVKHAAQFAAQMDATMHLLHVITIIPTAPEIVQSLEPQGDLSARQRLQRIADAELVGIKNHLHTKLAFAAHIPKSILATAQETWRRSYRNGHAWTNRAPWSIAWQRRGSGSA